MGKGSSFEGAKSLGIERPPPGHFDQPDEDDQDAGEAHSPDTDDRGPDSPAADKPSDGAGEQGGESGDGGAAPAGDSSGGSLAGAGAGWVLGLLLWGWIVLPFFKGGPTQVSKVLRAKFLNQAPDGSQLP